LQFFPSVLAYFGVMELVNHAGDLSGVDGDYMRRIAFAMLGCYIGFALFLYVSLLISHVAAFNILFEIRMKLATKLSKLELGYFNSTTSGAIKLVLNEDTEGLEAFVAHHTVDVVSALVVPIASLIAMGVIDWRLMLASIVLPPIGMFTYLKVYSSKKTQEAMRQYYEAVKSMGSQTIEFVNGIQVMKIFNQSGAGTSRFINSIRNHSAMIRKWAFSYSIGFNAFLTSIGSVFSILVPVGVIISYFEQDFKAFVPKLFFFLIVGGCMNLCVYKLMFIVSIMSRNIEGMKHIDEILYADELPERVFPSHPSDSSIEFENVSFSYGEREVLHNVSTR
jgi:ATP-binding cassette subfamily B protein